MQKCDAIIININASTSVQPLNATITQKVHLGTMWRVDRQSLLLVFLVVHVELCTTELYLKVSFGTLVSSFKLNLQSLTCPLCLLMLRKKCSLWGVG